MKRLYTICLIVVKEDGFFNRNLEGGFATGGSVEASHNALLYEKRVTKVA